MVADKSAEVSDMFRFGMQMQMPKCLDQINYYGRGPIENYSDRNNVTDLGNYKQTVEEQFYSYIRPQETGTKTDIRWWKQTNKGGNGLMFISEAPFSASALNYSIDPWMTVRKKTKDTPNLYLRQIIPICALTRYKWDWVASTVGEHFHWNNTVFITGTMNSLSS